MARFDALSTPEILFNLREKEFYPMLTDEQLEPYNEEDHPRIEALYTQIVTRYAGRIYREQKKFYDARGINYNDDPSAKEHIQNLIKDAAQESLELAVHQNRLEITAQTDALTGLLRRDAFAVRFEMARSRVLKKEATEEESEIVFCFIDIDNMKRLNTVYGHVFVDKILEAMGQKINTLLRPGDAACRSGGDEILLMLTNVPTDKVKAAVERYYREISNICVIEQTDSIDPEKGKRVVDLSTEQIPEGYHLVERASVSIGVRNLERNAPEFLDNVTKETDQAASKTKYYGRGGITIATRQEDGSLVTNSYKFDPTQQKEQQFQFQGSENEPLLVERKTEQSDIAKEIIENLARTLICVNKKGHDFLPRNIENAIDNLAEQIHRVCYYTE